MRAASRLWPSAPPRPDDRKRRARAAAGSQGETELFIYPGFDFRAAGAMLTNFHLPKSSLLILVCAFAGTDFILSAYRHAVEAATASTPTATAC